MTGQKHQKNNQLYRILSILQEAVNSREKRQMILHVRLLIWFVFDYMPLQMVEGKGFKKLMSIVAPNYNIPSRNTIKFRIEKVYEDRKAALLGDVDRVDTVALTTDTWTSNATKNYLTITEHHIDSDWNLMTNVLVTREMPERHT